MDWQTVPNTGFKFYAPTEPNLNILNNEIRTIRDKKLIIIKSFFKILFSSHAILGANELDNVPLYVLRNAIIAYYKNSFRHEIFA